MVSGPWMRRERMRGRKTPGTLWAWGVKTRLKEAPVCPDGLHLQSPSLVFVSLHWHSILVFQNQMFCEFKVLLVNFKTHYGAGRVLLRADPPPVILESHLGTSLCPFLIQVPANEFENAGKGGLGTEKETHGSWLHPGSAPAGRIPNFLLSILTAPGFVSSLNRAHSLRWNVGTLTLGLFGTAWSHKQWNLLCPV